MIVSGQILALSIPCPAARALMGLGNLMIAPITVYIVFFPIIMVFGGIGRGQITSLIGTIQLYFGNRKKLIVFGVILLLGAVGGGFLAAANLWSNGCVLG